MVGGDFGMTNGAIWRIDMRDRSKLQVAKDEDVPFRMSLDGPWIDWSARGVVGAGRILRVAR